jgi:hypothetical protein
MKIIREYRDFGMKKIEYNGHDADVLKNRFTQLKPETIDRLCEWLIKNNAIIDANDCYDAQSGWKGTNFIVGHADLSLNGYCLSNSSVELFLNGGQDPMWYNRHQPEFEEAKRWVAANNHKENN